MFGKIRLSRWLIGVALLALAEGASVAAIDMMLTAPAQAQFFGNDNYPARRPRPPRSGGFFQNLFGPFEQRPYYENEQGRPQREQPTDNSRAPAPRKADTKDKEQVAPTTSIVVMGDGMADWLAYGLEDAFSDSPEVAIVRKDKPHSGLLRYEPKGDLDWWHVAHDILAQEKANYVVMMLGVSDRQNIREQDLAKEAEKKAKDEQDKAAAGKNASTPDQAKNTDRPIIAPPEAPHKKTNGVIEFRTDEWAKIYSRRIDETIAALKSKGVPVFWVGLPSIRGTRSTADAVYLNDLYRARAERAGVVYIDVWDGFVDEAGKYSTFGPDYEGQTRRLRSGDGVYFTKYGARKLAHYVEREIRRYMSNHVSLTLPSGPFGPLPGEGKPAVRPLAGPVVPLTVTPGNSEILLGGAGGSSAHGDAIATEVLVKGEPVTAPPGRADDFAWPPGSDANKPAATPPAPAPNAPPVKTPEAKAVAPAVAVKHEPTATLEKKPAESKRGGAGKAKLTTTAKPKRIEAAKPKPRNNAPRPPLPIGRSGGFFGWLH
jgi:hypothetical protein